MLLIVPPARRKVQKRPVELRRRVLRCEQCRYELTGLDVDRCPECGSEFDRVALEAALGRPPFHWGEVAFRCLGAPVAVGAAIALLPVAVHSAGVLGLLLVVLVIPIAVVAGVGAATSCAQVVVRQFFGRSGGAGVVSHEVLIGLVVLELVLCGLVVGAALMLPWWQGL